MDQATSRSSKNLTPRQLRSLLGSFRPSEAAFVLHLAHCERCRGLTERFLASEETIPSAGYFASLSSLERDFILELTRGGLLLSLATYTPAAQQEDLPITELRSFLESLQPEQDELIRHILISPESRRLAAKALAPKGRRPRQAAPSVSPAMVLQ
jgi:hypothetical protein